MFCVRFLSIVNLNFRQDKKDRQDKVIDWEFLKRFPRSLSYWPRVYNASQDIQISRLKIVDEKIRRVRFAAIAHTKSVMDSSAPKLSRHHRELKQADGTSLMCFSQWNRNSEPFRVDVTLANIPEGKSWVFFIDDDKLSDMKRTTGNDNLDLLLVSAFKDKRNQSRFDHWCIGSTFAMVHVSWNRRKWCVKKKNCDP